MASDDDTSYKQLFAHPEMVRDLLLGFVPGTWVRQLDLASFERVSGSYVGDGGQQRHSDMVWKVRLSDEWIYIYLLLEFQSRSDPWMALRMQVYIGLLYQDLVKRRELPQPGKLPPVCPVVLYNGKQPWSASMSLADLVAPMPLDLQALQAAQRYVLVDQWRLSSDALALLDNFAATAFRVERLQTEQEVAEELERWSSMPEFANNPGLLSRLSLWSARRLQWLGRQRIINFDHVVAEGAKMGTPVIKCFADAWRYEAELFGHRDRLERLLVKRFGGIPMRLRKRIENAEMDDLDRWFDRLFDAKSVRDVFTDKQQG